MAKLTEDVKKMLVNKRDELKGIAGDMEITSKIVREHPITDGEIRDLVKLFYQLQHERIAVGNEAYAEIKNAYMEGKEANPLLLLRIQNNLEKMENDIEKFLKYYASKNPVGIWMMSHKGIGGVYAAGLLAYIDIDRCQTAGSIWRYAGITGNPEFDRKQRGKRISYNPDLKVLCWKIGDNFVKVHNKDDAVYGKLYEKQLAFYKQKNEAGGFAERAASILKEKNITDKKQLAALNAGKLTDGHLNSMAKRYAVKIFLSHLFDVWFEYRHGLKPPAPFVQEHLGHVHIIAPPNKELLIPNTTDPAVRYRLISNDNEEFIIRSELTDIDELVIRCRRYIERLTNHYENPSKLKLIKKIYNNDTEEVIFEDVNVDKIITVSNESSNEDTGKKEIVKKTRIPYKVIFNDGTEELFKTSNDPVKFARNKFKNKKDTIDKIINMNDDSVVEI